MSLEDTIAEVNPSVVSIVVSGKDTQALGAGTIISDDGYVITNAHVAEGAEDISVILSNDEEYAATLIGIDVKTDIALLKVDNPHNFVPAVFADSDLVRVGNTVFAIGNPFGLGNSVSLGIISAKERDIEKGPYDNFLQTDTAINQGNSGGPLFNSDGEMVGMNTAIFSLNGNNMGVGFSTPSNIVRWVVEELKENGQVERGWLGISVQKIYTSNDIHKNKLAVASMSEDSPAALAGIKVGDVLQSVGDMELKNPRLFSLQVSQTKPGTVLPVSLMRDGKELKTDIKLAPMPQEKKNISSSTDESLEPEASYRHRIATHIAELGLGVEYDDKTNEVVVISVDEETDASAKGIRNGDRFKSLNGRKIFGIEDLLIKVKEAIPNKQVILQFIGEEGIDTITLRLKDDK